MSVHTAERKEVAHETIYKSLAWAVAEGDIVNFRFLFMPASPLREDSPEDIDAPKYAYLRPEDESLGRFQQALQLVSRPDTAHYVRGQLSRKGPPQLPWELVQALADNAVRLGKYTAAAQAYELLRIRRRMQEILLDKTDALLANDGDMDAAVKGCMIAAGLDYDYAAFPEPLPAVPNYQERALALHGVYPEKWEAAPGMCSDEVMPGSVLGFLLSGVELAGRFDALPIERKTDFTARLIRATDPGWDAFAAAYREAWEIVKRHKDALARINSYSPDALGLLYEDLLTPQDMDVLRGVPDILLGAASDERNWWQFLKALAYHHPGAALFVARQRLSTREEILIPLCREDSLLAQTLGLVS